MEGLLIVLSSLISGIIASFITMKFTRENLKTTKYIDTITSERIKWIQLVRSDLTELVSSILIHQKNTDHLNDLIEDKIIQDDEISFSFRDPDSFAPYELAKINDLQRDIDQTEKIIKAVMTRNEIVNKAILLRFCFNSNEDSEIISQLNLIIDNFADSSIKMKDLKIDIVELTEKAQQVLKNEWEKVKSEVRTK